MRIRFPFRETFTNTDSMDSNTHWTERRWRRRGKIERQVDILLINNANGQRLWTFCNDNWESEWSRAHTIRITYLWATIGIELKLLTNTFCRWNNFNLYYCLLLLGLISKFSHQRIKNRPVGIFLNLMKMTFWTVFTNVRSGCKQAEKHAKNLPVIINQHNKYSKLACNTITKVCKCWLFSEANCYCAFFVHKISMTVVNSLNWISIGFIWIIHENSFWLRQFHTNPIC